MSRVEPKEQPPAERKVEQGRRQPSQAEGDEKTVDQALKRQEKKAFSRGEKVAPSGG